MFVSFVSFDDHLMTRITRILVSFVSFDDLIFHPSFFSLVKLRCFFSPVRTSSISPHPTMSLWSSSFALSLYYQIQDNNNTKHNTQHEQFILHYASHCRSARLAVGSHRAINQFHRRMFLCPHHRLLYGMALQPSHLRQIPRGD